MGFLIGLVAGGVLSYIFFRFFKKKPSGSFVIDFSDPMKDVCTLELDENINAIYKKKQIVLRVITRNISQQ